MCVGADTAHNRSPVGSIPTNPLKIRVYLKFIWLSNLNCTNFNSNGFNVFEFVVKSTQWFYTCDTAFMIYYFYIFLPLYIYCRFFVTNYVQLNNLTKKLERWSTFISEISSTNSYSFLYQLRIFSVFLLLMLACFTLFKTNACFIFYNHLFFDNYSLKISILILFFIPTIGNSFLFFGKRRYTLLNLLTLAIIFLFPLFIFLFNSSTNLLTTVIILEILNLSIMLVLALLLSQEYKQTPFFINSIFIFFWASTISSLTFFIYLTFAYVPLFQINQSFFGYCLTSDLYYNKTVGFSFLNNNLNLLLLVIFLLKLGVPPFISWKLNFFNKVPTNFFYLYNTLYLFILLNLLFSLIIFQPSFFINILTINYIHAYIMFTVCLFLILFLRNSTLSYVFVVSTSATVIFIFWSLMHLTIESFTLNDFMFNNVNISDLSYRKLTVVFYIWIYILIMLMFSSKTLLPFTNNLNTSLFQIVTFLEQINSKKYSSTISFLLLVNFFLISGLPPFLTFYLKLFVVLIFQKNYFCINLILIWLFLFFMLIFYFKNIRYLLLQSTNTKFNILSSKKFNSTETLNVSSKKHLTSLIDYNLLNDYNKKPISGSVIFLLLPKALFFGFFILSDLIFLFSSLFF